MIFRIFLIAGLFLLGKLVVSKFVPPEAILPLVVSAIVLTGAFFVWRKFAEQAEAFFKVPIVRKISLTILLVGSGFAYFHLLIRWPVEKLIEGQGISYYQSWLLIILLQPFIGGALLRFTSPIWGNGGKANRGFRIISFIGVVMISYLLYLNPHQFFKHETGETKFWVSDTENRIYFSSGYGVEDGQPLRKGTAKDAKKHIEENPGFWEKLKEKAEKAQKEAEARGPRPLTRTIHIPAGELVNTGIRITEKDLKKRTKMKIYQDKPKEFWIVNDNVADIKIAQRRFLCRAITTGPNLRFRGGPEPTTIRIKIYHTRR